MTTSDKFRKLLTQRRKVARKPFRNAAALCVFAPLRERSSPASIAMKYFSEFHEGVKIETTHETNIHSLADVMLTKETLTNKILSGLPEAESARLIPLLQSVSLSAGERLSEAGDAVGFIYFPENSVLSCQVDMQDGRTAEVGMIGFEGLADITALVGSSRAAHSLNVSIGGSALRVTTDDFKREIMRGDGLQRSLLAYAYEYITQISQRSACAVFHTVEQRFAVWLLLLTDRIEKNVIPVTHARIADLLGVRRAGVTVVASDMQATGAITYRRGSLRVDDRQILEIMACECYGTLALNRQQTYIGSSS